MQISAIFFNRESKTKFLFANKMTKIRQISSTTYTVIAKNSEAEGLFRNGSDMVCKLIEIIRNELLSARG